MLYTLYTDGASRGNGGDSAASFLILDDMNKEVGRGSSYINKVTNNVAEYIAVLNGITYCNANNMMYIKVISDSMLVMKQLSGEWKTKDPELKKLRSEIKNIVKIFDYIKYEWHPRNNLYLSECDRMNNECLDNYLNNL